MKDYLISIDQFTIQLLALTRVELEESLVTLEKQAGSHDWKGLNSTGHKLYGTAASAGLSYLAGLARKFEKQGEDENSLVKALISQIQIEIALVFQLMADH